MLTDMWNEFSSMRAEDLRCVAAHQRLAGAAAPRHAASPRQRLGRRLIFLGAAMARERVWFVPTDL